MTTPDVHRSPTLVIPAGVAAVQARISALESRFLPMSRPDHAATVDFERILGAAKAGRVSADLHADHAHGPDHVHTHEMGAAGAPPELAHHGNGRIPPTELQAIGRGNHRLWEPAAESFRALATAAARAGVAIGVTDSYRSYDEQVSLAERKGIYGQGGLAAVPGTSNHGWGRSLDLDLDPAATEWMRANAPAFGFHEDVPGEPWHWTYRPA